MSLSSRLPVSLLIGVRQLARRPRRAILNAASVTVTVTGIVAILESAASVHTGAAGAIANLKIQRLDDVMRIITGVLIIVAALNTTFIAWATATDGRFASALQRALGATARQVTAGLSVAALLPAFPAALIGVPLGIAVYRRLDPGQSGAPPTWQLAGVVLLSLIAVGTLTAVPSRSAAQRTVAEILRGD